MQTVIVATFLALLAVFGLGLGVLLGRRPLEGSCGGIACGGACSACPNRKER
ncbi:hypothetical protein [Arsenicitalea aurantiaca]|uniref:hypothetical protein n=1 Tax=Arsenicitalea aurantiaca TaxID=1783274 RepID=UPI001863E484|nr:hypothetical protein [Arsenicitalea aurantiaca]